MVKANTQGTQAQGTQGKPNAGKGKGKGQAQPAPVVQAPAKLGQAHYRALALLTKGPQTKPLLWALTRAGSAVLGAASKPGNYGAGTLLGMGLIAYANGQYTLTSAGVQACKANAQTIAAALLQVQANHKAVAGAVK